MASPHEDSRRRPQRIDVPDFVTYPASASLAFADANQADKSGNPKQQEGNDLRSPAVRRSTSTKSASSKSRDSGSTTVTNLMDRARGLSVPATSRRHRATHSNPTTALVGKHSEQLFDGTEDVRTGRAKLEAETEHKYHRMMGQIPNTPVKDTQPSSSDIHYQINDLRPRVSIVSKSSTIESSDRTKSPKKKLFGVSLPSFKVTSNPNSTTPPPALPGKVAKILGSSPPPTKTRNKLPYANRSLPSSSTSRSANISKAVPSSAYRQHAQYHRSYHRRPIIHPGDSSYPRRRASGGKPSAKDRVSADHISKSSYVHISSSEAVTAPTPPQKDTPPSSGVAPAVQPISSMTNTVHEEPAPRREKVVDHGMKSHIPTLFALDPDRRSQPGYSPTKYSAWGAEEYAKIVECERIKSAYGALDGGSIESTSERSHIEPYQAVHGCNDNEVNKAAPLDNSLLKQLQRPTSPLYFRVEAEANSDPDYLPATTYQLPPANIVDIAGNRMDADRFSVAVSSSIAKTHSSRSNAQNLVDTLVQGRVPQRTANTAIPTTNSDSASPHRAEQHNSSNIVHHDKHELQLDHPHLSRFEVGNGHFQPENSASQLTDMLNAVSPSKIEFHELRPQSAVPSPLHRNGIPPQFDFEPMRAKGFRSVAMNELANANDCSQTHGLFNGWENVGEESNRIQPQFIHRGVNKSVTTDFTMGKVRQPPTGERPEIGQTVTAYEPIDPVASSQRDKGSKRPTDRTEDSLLNELRYSAMLEKRLAVVESDYENLKSQMHSNYKKGSGNPDQIAKLTTQLDKISEYIKSDIVKPLHAHIHRCADMEQDIKGLRRTLQELQQTMEGNGPWSTMRAAFRSTSPSPFRHHQTSSTGNYNHTSSMSADAKIHSVWDE